MLRRRSGLPVVLLLAVLVTGCAGEEATDGPDHDSPTTPASTSTISAPDDPADEMPSAAMPDTFAVAELGYPRDLLDRGRVNVVVSRDGDEPFVVLEHRLRIDGFAPAPREDRRIVMPENGRRVAIQAVFGEVVDCESPTPLAASLDVRYLVGDDTTVHDGAIELDDTDTLAAIRSRFCTARRVLAENDIVLGEPTLDGERFALDLVISRRSGDAPLVVHAIEGTVLFGAESPFEQGAPQRTLAADADELVLPLTFDVNRCDPHAVAETTKRQGLTLWIGVDGEQPQPVDVDISSIEDDLDLILERCRSRTGR